MKTPSSQSLPHRTFSLITTRQLTGDMPLGTNDSPMTEVYAKRIPYQQNRMISQGDQFPLLFIWKRFGPD